MQGPYPSIEEMLVNEHILEQCMHPSFKICRDQSLLFSVCPICEKMIYLQGSPSRDEVRNEWRRNQIRPAHNPINASQVERKLSAQGWTVMNYQRDGLRYRCIAQRWGQRLQSEVCASRNEAIVQVAAKIVRGGLFTPSGYGIVRPID